jgi:hypothetical protein
MERTYIDDLPEDMVNILLYKLCVTLDVYSFIIAVKLDPQVSYYKLSLYLCEYFRDIPIDSPVGYSTIDWMAVYNLLTCVIYPERNRIINILSRGLFRNILGKLNDEDNPFKTTLLGESFSKVSMHALFDHVYNNHECTELFLVLLYKFNKLKDVPEMPRLSLVLYRILKYNNMYDYQYDAIFSKVIEYRRAYVDSLLPTFKIMDKSRYEDIHGFIIDKDDGSCFTEDILSLYCYASNQTDDAENLARDLGYALCSY